MGSKESQIRQILAIQEVLEIFKEKLYGGVVKYTLVYNAMNGLKGKTK